jgi:bacteriorhodopsin
VVGFSAATEKNPECVRGLLVKARYLTVISWLTYPGVYIIKMVGISGASASG